MSHHMLQLRPKGLLARMEWYPVSRRHIERLLDDDELVAFLNDSVCFAEGVTLRDLMELILRDDLLFGIVSSCHCLGEFAAELGQKIGKKSDGVASLEVSWSAVVSSDPLPVLRDAVDFHGRDGDNGMVAIEFTPVNHLADLPILLDEAFDIRDSGGNVLFSATRHFSLLEVVRGVLDELTFLGTPAERDEAMSEIESRAENVDIDKFLTFEEVAKDLERRQEEDRKRFPCHECGSDSRCACFGKPSDLCHECFNNKR
jgi:hypothetical protein